jgi:hypothetical protein
MLKESMKFRAFSSYFFRWLNDAPKTPRTQGNLVDFMHLKPSVFRFTLLHKGIYKRILKIFFKNLLTTLFNT